MTDFNDQTRHDQADVARRLSAALAPVAGDLDCPDHDRLTAFVDQQLDEADAEWINSHLLVCATCTTDVADLREVQQQLTARGPGRRWIAYASVAAALALIAWAGSVLRPTPSSEAPQIATVSPPAPIEPAAPAGLSATDQALVARALETGTPQLPAFHEVIRGHVGVLLGADSVTAPLTPSAPVGTAITTTRPVFAWSEGVGATSYEVAVFDEQFAEVARSGVLTTTRWTPDRDLPRGQVLAWQITATGPAGSVTSPAPPQPEARFVVLTAAEVTAVAAARERLMDDPLALGLTLAQAGLYRDAEAALTRAAGDSRYDTEQVRRILAALRTR